jgi:hypothetical protein
METQTDQGSEIQGGMGTTQIPIDYMDTRMEQLYPSPELCPAASTRAKSRAINGGGTSGGNGQRIFTTKAYS